MSRVSLNSSFTTTAVSLHYDDENDTHSTDDFQLNNSSGAARASATQPFITIFDRSLILISLFIVSFSISLDSVLRFTFQMQAADSLENLALISTITTVRGVMAAAVQPTAAKLADVFGRSEIIVVSFLFYSGGSLVEALSTSMVTFCFGAVLFQIGWSFILLMLEIIVTDITSLRARTFFLYIVVVPYLATPWIGGALADVMLEKVGWRWAIGALGMGYPFTIIPLVFSLRWVQFKAKRAGNFADLRTPSNDYRGWKLIKTVLWQLDIVGLVLMTTMLGFILTPLTLADGFSHQWRRAKIIAPLTVGLLTIPAFIWWETQARYPMMPFNLFRDRAVWGALGLAITFNCAWAIQSDYLFTNLVVAYGDTLNSATTIINIYTFSATAVGIVFSVIIFYVRRLKPFILLGVTNWFIAFALMIYFRGGFTWSVHTGIVVGQVFLGIGGGLFQYPSMASIQSAAKHEHVALLTGVFLGVYHIGAATGNAISGAIWSQLMPRELSRRLPGDADAEAWFKQPLLMMQAHPIGDPQRDAVVEAMMKVQRLICTTGLVFCVLIFLFALVIRNPRLGDEQTMPDAEERSIRHDGVAFDMLTRRFSRRARRGSGVERSGAPEVTEVSTRPVL